jgi:hypothetical protein
MYGDFFFLVQDLIAFDESLLMLCLATLDQSSGQSGHVLQSNDKKLSLKDKIKAGFHK